uniref:Microsomal glutathione S-transferase 1 n=1 Tax=Cyprinus carpio TaxID=7962 RepID=A0A8C2F871_CYPCA
MAETVHMIDSEVFLAFSTYATIVVLKMMLMSLMTSYFRLTKQNFSVECDGKHINGFMTRSLGECHLNDLENIVPFVVIGLLYALTGPDLSMALLHFRVFVGSRFIHTVAYVMALPQPTRALAFGVGLFITFSMAYRVLTTALFL